MRADVWVASPEPAISPATVVLSEQLIDAARMRPEGVFSVTRLRPQSPCPPRKP
jgi:hypothetical protein